MRLVALPACAQVSSPGESSRGTGLSDGSSSTVRGRPNATLLYSTGLAVGVGFGEAEWDAVTVGVEHPARASASAVPTNRKVKRRDFMKRPLLIPAARWSGDRRPVRGRTVVR